MNLGALLTAHLKSTSPHAQLPILGLSSDSRATQQGEVFALCATNPKHWPMYLAEAVHRGAIAVLYDPSVGKPDEKAVQVPLIPIPSLTTHLGSIASSFYGDPSHHMDVIGITGTNGKTSCSLFTAQCLESMGIKCGVIGTLGSGFPADLQSTGFTTPFPIQLHKTLAQLRSQGATHISMEVSSHALEQYRVSGMRFRTAVFTNLTRDHLDYHVDMEAYSKAKKRLFEWPSLSNVIINADDEFGHALLSENQPHIHRIGYTTNETPEKSNWPLIQATQIRFNQHGMRSVLHTPWGTHVLGAHLIGRFNLYNLMAVFGAIATLTPDAQAIVQAISRLKPVPGRMQALGGGKLPLVVVDYAHTPAALQQALIALRPHCSGRLWCVFGCGGDRDPGKRPMMGDIAERYSDQLIITDDNPRTENPKCITDEILTGLSCPWAAELEHDRGAAITHAIDCAQAGDVVLIAGKGHETAQIVGNEPIPFDDVKQAQVQLKLKTKHGNSAKPSPAQADHWSYP